MKKFPLAVLIVFIALTVIFIYDYVQNAGKHRTGDIHIVQPYAFATTDAATTGAAFFMIENGTDKPVSLISAQSDVADIVELHQNLIDPDDGQMMMRKVKTINAPANGEAILKPTGHHVMFINLNAPLNVGDTIPVTVAFDNGHEELINVAVIAPGTKPEKSDAHDHHHGHNH